MAIRTCRPDDERTFVQRAAEFRPVLDVQSVGILRVIVLPVETDLNFVTIDSSFDEVSGTMNLYGEFALRVDLQIILCNSSQQEARIEYLLAGCGRSYEPGFRTRLLGGAEVKPSAGFNNEEGLWSPTQTTIKPAEIQHQEITVDLRNEWFDGMYTVHLYLIYQNVLGDWFDTYSWVDITIRPRLDLPAEVLEPDSITPLHFPLKSPEIPDTILLVRRIEQVCTIKGTDHKVYSKKEARVLDKILDRWRKSK
ncbi:hypothetical protein KKH27_13620 [bacterium]|nr:hypothetical protein [bacterium]MBU1983117.1 hypothetical protein [bacterium]